MSEKRRGLGRGLGALIPTSADSGRERPVDVFFPSSRSSGAGVVGAVLAADSQDDGLDGTREGQEVGAAGGETTTGGSTIVKVRSDATNGTTDRPNGTTDRPNGTTDRPNGTTDRVAASLDGRDKVRGPLGEGTGVQDDDLLPVPGATFAEIPVSSIQPNARQPRSVFDEEQLDELVASIREVGVLQPVVVRPAGDGYELIMGERRWRATQAAGLETIPAIIRQTDDGDMLRDALLENLHRAQLNPLEEAAAYQQLLDDFGCTQEELAGRIHRSRPQISNTLRLLKLPPLVQRRVAAGVLSAGHARALLGLPDAAASSRGLSCARCRFSRRASRSMSPSSVWRMIAGIVSSPAAWVARHRRSPMMSS